VPAGAAGPVDVVTQNGDDTSTRRSLTSGYTYDAFYLTPASGPTAGGTVVTVRGDTNDWDAATEVLIDFVPCAPVVLKAPNTLECTTPKGSPGAKPVRVQSRDGVTTDVLDAFTYGNSDNGFRGGLSGGAIAGSLRVLALDNYTGSPIPNALVVLEQGVEVQRTDATGVALMADSDPTGPQTVTVGAKCFQPITFVAVPVDTVTAYLDPVISPACISEGDPPVFGGSPGSSSTVSGEIVWQSASEFDRSGWTNVPQPKSADEVLVAYVFRLASRATDRFRLPSAIGAITPQSGGESGFDFSLSTSPGNFSVYALAGIENRTQDPPLFTAYAMGITQGVTLAAGETKADVFIAIDVPLDHALQVEVEGPATTSRGPDRLRTGVAIRVDDEGYALLPNAQRSSLYPGTTSFSFVGVPPLSGSLAGTQYSVSASAFTGDSEGTPRSVAAMLGATSSSASILVDGFVQVPRLLSPISTSSWNGTELDVDWAAGGAAPELTVYEVESAGGLVVWTIAAPASNKQIRLPNLLAMDPEVALLPGLVTIRVTTADIQDFDYGSLRYRQLGTRGWNAYATDVFFSRL
jgi:hypothetical protein